MNVREWALPIYTILIQIAVGATLVLWVIRSFGISKFGRAEIDRFTNTPILVVFFTVFIAMIGSHFHLSKPLLSFLAMLNFRTSWLSREVFFTVLFFFSAGWLWYLQWFVADHGRLKTVVGWLAVFAGVMTEFCMSRIYLMPTQAAWNSAFTIASFMSTTLLLGVMAIAALMIIDLRFAEVREEDISGARTLIVQKSLFWLALAAIAAVMVIVAINFSQIILLRAGDQAAQTSLSLLLGLYRPLFGLCLLLLLFGVGCLVFSAVLNLRKRKTVQELLTPVYSACLLVMIGEILGRFLFYATHVRLGIS